VARQLRDVIADLPRFLTAPLLRPWHLHWGATHAEVAAVMPGDALMPRARYRSTRAITGDATPQDRTPPPVDHHRLAVIRAVHTAAWASIEACVGYLQWSGAVGRSDNRPPRPPQSQASALSSPPTGSAAP
jgi:hypothetical protein